MMDRKKFLITSVSILPPIAIFGGAAWQQQHEKPMPEFFRQYIMELNKPQLEELYAWLDTEPMCLQILLEAIKARGKEVEGVNE